MFFCVTAVYLCPMNAWLQATLMLASQFYFCIYLAEVQPFERKWIGRLEMMNNTVILFSIYWIYLFAGLITCPIA